MLLNNINYEEKSFHYKNDLLLEYLVAKNKKETSIYRLYFSKF